MKRSWWKEAVVYQIYPISFKDSNSDGMGDLNGIIEKLDYIAELGVDIVWISPFFKSPYIDNGYDISDYRDIDERFGIMKDWEKLIEEMHKRGLKFIMDLVVNHCSNQHKWFQEAKKSKDNQYRDYFIWKDGKGKQEPPNNWTSYFGGSAWEYDDTTNQYYLHLFTKEQPDLNWANPELRQEIYKIMIFWAEKGIDGFRLDVMHAYGKAPGLPDGEVGKHIPVGLEHYKSIPSTHEYIKEMNRKVFSKYNLFTVGETGNVNIEDAIRYTSEDSKEVNMVFQFEHVDIKYPESEDGLDSCIIPIKKIKSCLAIWQRGLMNNGWNSLYLSNHDQPRQVSRFGNDINYHKESAKMLATIMHLQKGTPFIYQGEEIGMTNYKVKCIDEVHDINAITNYKELVKTGNMSAEEFIRNINRIGRDNSRTPMQWNTSENAGFTDGKPWIKVNPNYKIINVEIEKKDNNSILNYYKKLIALRKNNPVVVYGDFTEYHSESDKIFVFTRSFEDKTLLVIANMTENFVDFIMPEDITYRESKLYIANYDVDDEPKNCNLRPYEAKVYLLR